MKWTIGRSLTILAGLSFLQGLPEPECLLLLGEDGVVGHPGLDTEVISALLAFSVCLGEIK